MSEEVITTSEPATTAAAPVVDQVAPDAAQVAPEAQAPSTETQNTVIGSPEKYEFAAPEGLQYDPSIIGQFSEVAKELNLPQEAAQKILDKMQPALAKQQAEAMASLSSQWEQAATADKEYGGEKLQENLGVAKSALDKFGSPELKDLLNKSGFGNHPDVIRLLYRVGKQMGNDSIVTNGNSSSTASTVHGTNSRLAEALYNSKRS